MPSLPKSAVKTPARLDSQVTLPTRWVGLEDQPILFANAFLGQLDEKGDVILTIGAAYPPIATGTTQAERVSSLRKAGPVQIRTHVRVSLSATRIQELMVLLGETLANQAKYMKALEELGAKDANTDTGESE